MVEVKTCHNVAVLFFSEEEKNILFRNKYPKTMPDLLKETVEDLIDDCRKISDR